MAETNQPIPGRAAQTPAAAPPPQTKAVAVSAPPAQVMVFEVPVVNEVARRVLQFAEMGMIHLPADYSPENALKSAELILKDMTDKNGKPILGVVTGVSVANALYTMTVEGLNPMKKQGGFIQYGDKLMWQREYAGNIALAKRYGNLKEISGNVIYKDDVFEFEVNPETGRKRIIKHTQTIDSIDNNNIKGAYAVVTLNDGSTDLEIMNIDQIRRSWQQGAAKGDSPAHKNFPDQMCLKTVKSRAVKLLIRTSDDASIVTPDPDMDEVVQEKPTFKEMKQEVKEITIQASVVEEAPKVFDVTAQDNYDANGIPTVNKTEPKAVEKPF